MALGLFSSCVSSIEYPCNDFLAEVVIHSVFSPDSSWHVDVTKSKCRFDENDDFIIPNVEVTITNISADPNYDLNVEDQGNGRFHVTNKSIPGNIYRISVEAQINDEIIFAESFGQVPNVPEPIVEVKEYLDDGGQKFYEIDFKLRENEYDENYYIMNLVEIDDEENPADSLGNGNQDGVPFEYDSEITFRNEETGFATEYIDKNDFNGGEYNNTIITPIGKNGNNSGGFEEGKYIMNIQSVSEDLFIYYKTLEEYKSHTGPNSSISDPIAIHSNIKNGLGIFGAYNQTRHLIKP